MFLQAWGRKGLEFFQKIGEAGIFLARSAIGPMPQAVLIQQLYAVGVLSLVILAVSGFFIGSVLALQGYYTLSRFNASEAIGQLLALSVLRELGPVVTALLFAGRAGSSLTSEIGLMKATEQLASMQMMGVDPLRRVIAPRFWAAVISMPILNLIFCMISIIGGYLVAVKWLGISGGAFWSNMRESVSFGDDVLNGCIKSVVFGFAVSWIAVYQGFTCVPTSQGIANATTKTVVYASLMVLGLDFFLTAVMFK